MITESASKSSLALEASLNLKLGGTGLQLDGNAGGSIKESVIKALKEITIQSLNEIEICHNINNDPFIILHGQCKKIMQKKRINQWLISISHEEHYAIATAIGGFNDSGYK